MKSSGRNAMILRQANIVFYGVLASAEYFDPTASQAEAAEAAGKSARWLWTQLNEGGEFLNAYKHAVQSLQKQSQLTALQRSRDVMDVVTSIAVDRKHKDCLKAAQLILQLNKR